MIDGFIHKHKAILVVKIYSHQSGVDFIETFALVAWMETIITVIVLVAQIELTMFQHDFKSIFLKGEIKEEVYVK